MSKLFTFLLCLLASPALAAIAIDADSSAGSAGSVASLTFAHTVASGSNRMLIISCGIRSETVALSTVTYNGVAATLYGRNPRDGGGNLATEMWYLPSPDTGTHNIVVTPVSSQILVCGATSFTGVQQSGANGPFRSVAAILDHGTGTNATVDVTGAVAGDVQIDIAAIPLNTAVLTAGGGQTQRWNNISTSGFVVEGFSSTESGSGTVTMGWTHDSANNCSIAGSLVPAVARPASGPIFFP